MHCAVFAVFCPAECFSPLVDAPRREMPRVLLIDDADGVRKVLGAQLSPRGYTVDTAANAVDGASLFASRTPDVAIIDAELADADGLQLARDLAAASPTTGFIIVSGSTGEKLDAVRSAATSLFGALSFFSKPMPVAELCRRVDQLSGAGS